MNSKINNFLEFFPYLVNKKLDFFLSQLGNLEDLIFKEDKSKIEKPIFICGLARSGTTALLNNLYGHKDIGSFEYKDLPFVKTLHFWNQINKFFYKGLKSDERLHGDGIFINQNSPEAIEELIWRNFIKDYEISGFFNFLNEDYENKKLEEYLFKQIKKILKIRGNKTRYLSKGNYNIFRIRYIKKIFPNAKIIICFRDPIETSISSIKVHKKFLDLSKKNKYFDTRLNFMCHFEFGEKRKSVAETYQNSSFKHFNQEQYYYLKQWYKIYEMVLNDYKDLDNIIFINNKTILEKPDFIYNLLNKLELDKKLFSVKKLSLKKNNHDIKNEKNKSLNELYDHLNFLEQKTLFKNV